MKNDFHWTIENVDYVIRNVPYEIYHGEEFLGIGDSLKLAMIRDLMVADEIPHDVDFNKVADLKFEDY